MQPRRPRVATVQDMEKKRREDEAIIELIRDTVERLNGLGDRLEEFVAQGERRGGKP